MTIDLRYLTGGITVILQALVWLGTSLSMQAVYIGVLAFGISLVLWSFGHGSFATRRRTENVA